jgi:hypothetical protein
LKLLNHLLILSACRWKTLSFLTFHSSQAAVSATSVKHGTLFVDLACANLSCSCSVRSHCTPILAQQLYAKEQLKKRCSIVSCSPLLHMIHVVPSCTFRFLLSSIVLVLSLLTRISHAKNLILGIHLDFQIIL